MLIKGFQKTTLIDYPEKIACAIFLHGCNFRCGFCHNPELVLTNFKSKLLTSNRYSLIFFPN